jgi:hypothetical protein
MGIEYVQMKRIVAKDNDVGLKLLFEIALSDGLNYPSKMIEDAEYSDQVCTMKVIFSSLYVEYKEVFI